MSGQTDWLSAIGILLAGLVLGFMFVFAYVMKRRGQQPALAEDLELRDLEAKRDALLQQLRDLDANEKEERARLEVEAAQVLRKIDQHVGQPTPNVATGFSPSPSSAVPTSGTGFFARHPELKGFAWGVGSIGVIALLWYFGFQSAKPKDEGGPAPMQQAAQSQPQQQQQGPDDATIRELESRVEKSPDDLNARIELVHAYLDKENLMGVFAQTEYILKKDPKNAPAETYQALVRIAMGQSDPALKLLKSAVKDDPKFLDAWVTLAYYHTQHGEKTEARKAIDEAIKVHPEQKARLDQVLAEMEQQRAASSQAPVEASTLPPGHPPVEGTPNPQPMASASSTGGAIVITVNLAPGKSVPQSGVLYIMARGVGETAGPPLAVKRVAATTFPITVDLSAADSMMGQEIPAKVRVEARLDADGNVMTHGPDDLDAVQDGVAKGSQVSLTLK